MYVKRIFLTALVVLLSSCTFVPVEVKNEKYECYMKTNQLTLSTEKIRQFGCSGSNIGALGGCLFAYAVVVPVGSFIISGGVVLLGNTIHWLEYQGTCDESYLLQSLDDFKKSIN